MSDDKIPIRLTYHGQEYNGFFSPVSGGASKSLFFLTLINPPGKQPGEYNCGQLWLTDNFGWHFASNNHLFEDMVDFFADYVVAWYQ